MRGEMKAHVSISMPWWFDAYTNMLIFICVAFGAEPDWEKFEAFVCRHVKIKVKVK